MMNLNLIVLFSFFINTYIAPHQKIDQEKRDEVDYKKIAVVNTAKRSFAMGSRAQLEKAFGKGKVVKQADEVLGGSAYMCYYNGLEVYFHEKDWEGMIIKGKDFKLILNGIPYSIGDNFDKLKTAFPVSFKGRKENGIAVGIKNSDSFISFDHDKNGKITRMEVANANW